MSAKYHIAIMGGGTGSFVVASGLHHHDVEISMLLTMVDDGGSNKVLRDEFGLLPTSGIRQSIVALSKNQTMLRKLFTYRYDKGGPGLKGMTFGNLFMAAMADIMGSQRAGIEETCHLLQVKGYILPISYDDVRLVAQYEDGSTVVGEHLIDEPSHSTPLRITQLSTQPTARISPEAKEALMKADLVVLGPGDFYTNTITNLVVKGVVEALQETPAKIAFVLNLMTKFGETPDYRASNFLSDLARYLPLSRINYVLLNNNFDFPPKALDQYHQEASRPVEDDLAITSLPTHLRVLRKNLLSKQISPRQTGDVLARSTIRHDAKQLAHTLLQDCLSC